MIYRNTPGILLQSLKFKELGQDKFFEAPSGKEVKVDRHGTEPGKFLVWLSKRRYAVVPGEELHLYVKFKDKS